MTATVTLRLDPVTLAELRRRAAIEGRTVSDTVRAAIRAHARGEC